MLNRRGSDSVSGVVPVNVPTIVVLRVFLAVVFLSAGVTKIADRNFLDPHSPSSMRASVLAVRGTSPLGGLLDPIANHTTFFGLAMAIGELAVGIGLALGLFTRIAAVGGMILSLSLWLTVSWNAQPWFTSADLVYLFALTPLAVGGAGRLPSLDAWLARTRAEHPAEDGMRRALLAGGAVLLGGVIMGGAALFRSKPGPPVVAPTAMPLQPAETTSAAPQTTTSPTGSAPTGPVVAKVSDVPVGGAEEVRVDGRPCWLLQLQPGQFTAYSAICPHQGCTVQFVSADEGFACPCHQSAFDAQGHVTRGPAAGNLPPIPVRSDGTSVRQI